MAKRAMYVAALASAGVLGCSGLTGDDVAGEENASGTGTPASLEICPESPAPELFKNALCLCENFNDVGTGLVVSSLAGAKANVGVNGRSQIVGAPNVAGDFVAYGGLSGVGQITVAGDFVSTQSVQGVGRVTVGGDASVGGNISSVGQLEVAGTLRLAGSQFGVGQRSVGGTGPYTAPAGPPCGCDAESFFDVAAAVANAKATNDNAAANLPSIGVIGQQDITLETGTYYFANVASIGKSTIRVNGAVALAIDGSLDSIGDEQIVIAPGATLDLYVSGGVRRVGHSALGGSDSSGQLRVYIGGTDPVMLLVGDHAVKGAVYAPLAKVSFVGNLKVEGALFARTLNGVGNLEIRYDAQSIPATCEGGGGQPTDGGSEGEPTDGGSNGGEPGTDGGTPGDGTDIN